MLDFLCVFAPWREIISPAKAQRRKERHAGDKKWDRWRDLRQIKTPTLVIGGKYDTMSVDDLKRESQLLPHARLAICEQGSHLAMWDDQQTYLTHLLRFLKDRERGIKL